MTDESTATLLRTETGSERSEFAVNAWLDGLDGRSFNKNFLGPDGGDPKYNDLSYFPHAMVFGKGGRPLKDLLVPANLANLTETANSMYKEYMA